MAKATLNPLQGWVVAQTDKAQTKTAAGLYIPDNAQQKSTTATVVSTGDAVMRVKTGDKIVYKEFSTTELKVEGEQYILVKEEDILATIS